MTTQRRARSRRDAKRLRNGGQTDRYRHDEFGVNSRLDEMQAAILRARLPLLPRVDRSAPRARPPLSRRAAGVDTIVVPPELDAGHVYHLFPVRSAGTRRHPGASAGGGHRDADPLPDSDPAPAGARHRASGRAARSRTASAARSSRCRSIRRSPTRRDRPRSPTALASSLVSARRSAARTSNDVPPSIRHALSS